MHSAGIHTHTYDARSGAHYRITRVGATASRLSAFADSVHYINELDGEKVREACLAVGLKIDNGELAKERGIPVLHKDWSLVTALSSQLVSR